MARRHAGRGFPSLPFWLVLPIVLGLAAPSWGGVLFNDDFDGTGIDPFKWNTDLATAGKRWCNDTEAAHHRGPGTWVDVAVAPCHDLTLAPPYGVINVSGGLAAFGNGIDRAFPYIWVGPPSRPSPFPASGDFTLEFRIHYGNIQGHGDGIIFLYWDDTDPVGNNPPNADPTVNTVLTVWADALNQVYAYFPGKAIQKNLGTGVDHDFRLDYTDGSYTLYRNDVLLMGPVANPVLPNAIWIGNPVFTHWAEGDWTDFQIDYIRVTVPTVDVRIDIKPGSDPNSINLAAAGVVPVAILSTDEFNAPQEVDPDTIALAGAKVKMVGKSGKLLCHDEDVNDDGLVDLVCQVLTADFMIETGDSTAVLEGETYDGTPIRGEDSIRIVPD